MSRRTQKTVNFKLKQLTLCVKWGLSPSMFNTFSLLEQVRIWAAAKWCQRRRLPQLIQCSSAFALCIFALSADGVLSLSLSLYPLMPGSRLSTAQNSTRVKSTQASSACAGNWKRKFISHFLRGVGVSGGGGMGCHFEALAETGCQPLSHLLY